MRLVNVCLALAGVSLTAYLACSHAVDGVLTDVVRLVEKFLL